MRACSLLLVSLLVDVGRLRGGGGEAALVSECATVSCSLCQPAMYFILIEFYELEQL